MAKKIVRSNGPRKDRYSKKRSGFVSQSVRLSVAENRLVRKAADMERMSISLWASRALVAAAKAQLPQAEPEPTPPPTTTAE